jgi:hypothetical protein
VLPRAKCPAYGVGCVDLAESEFTQRVRLLHGFPQPGRFSANLPERVTGAVLCAELNRDVIPGHHLLRFNRFFAGAFFV